jgi:adenylate cyclase
MGTDRPSDRVELELLRACARLSQETDDVLEAASRDRLPLRQVLEQTMAVLAEHSGSDWVWVKTWDEDLTLQEFPWHSSRPLASEAVPQLAVDAIWNSAQADEPYVATAAGTSVIAQRLDVAGDMFGAAALGITQALDAEATATAQKLLFTWCEIIDNFVASIARARKKHQVTLSLSRALKHPVLEAGISSAIEVLRREVDFSDLILAYLHENDLDGDSLNYRIIKNGELVHDSFRPEMLVDPSVRSRLFSLVRNNDTSITEHFGIAHYRDDVLITGVRKEHVVGRLLIANQHQEFNTFDRDLLERFADYVRQRVVDFNREWKVLSQTFPRDTVVRLLSEEDYLKRYLEPREKDVAVLFCDIAGFTRLSEQVLKEPELIGQLINTWSERVVQILWATGGVFDKMVGDCIIGLWGPPFYDLTPKEACERSVDAALQIRDYTNRLSEDMPNIANADFQFGVATGLNFAPLFVGLFGPNDDFTGFSSGMNNTARLQGVSDCDEILCMDSFADILGAPERFGELRTAQVKNVADALRFRALAQ